VELPSRLNRPPPALFDRPCGVPGQQTHKEALSVSVACGGLRRRGWQVVYRNLRSVRIGKGKKGMDTPHKVGRPPGMRGELLLKWIGNFAALRCP
jgi:hypothetical protein